VLLVPGIGTAFATPVVLTAWPRDPDSAEGPGCRGLVPASIRARDRCSSAMDATYPPDELVDGQRHHHPSHDADFSAALGAVM